MISEAKASKRLVMRTLLLLALAICLSFAWITLGHSQEEANNLKARYINISLELKDLDLSMRKVNFKISGIFGFNFSSPFERFPVEVYTDGNHVGWTDIVKVSSGENQSVFQIDGNKTDFSGYFSGGPETYPFDRYEFNFTISPFLQGVEASEADVSVSCWAAWPLKAQFEGPLDKVVNVSQSSHGPNISVRCALNRPAWQGYAILMPIYMIFALIGFTPLLKINSKGLTYRTSAYLSVLALAVGYSFSIQNMLPQGRYYLSLPEALVYTVIGSSTIFMITAFLASRMRFPCFFTDIVAGIFSVSLLNFLILTFYIAPYVEILTYHLASLPLIRCTLSALLFGGILAVMAHELFHYIRSRRKLPILSSLKAEKLDNLTRWVYRVGFSMHLSSLLIGVYTVWLLGPEAEPNPIRRTLFELTGNNVLLMVFSQSALTLVVLFSFYYIPRRRGMHWLSDFLGFSFLAVSLINFLATFSLFPTEPVPFNLIILAITILIGTVSVIFVRLRRRCYSQRCYDYVV